MCSLSFLLRVPSVSPPPRLWIITWNPKSKATLSSCSCLCGDIQSQWQKVTDTGCSQEPGHSCGRNPELFLRMEQGLCSLLESLLVCFLDLTIIHSKVPTASTNYPRIPTVYPHIQGFLLCPNNSLLFFRKVSKARGNPLQWFYFPRVLCSSQAPENQNLGFPICPLKA